jgi:hypothetical protein
MIVNTIGGPASGSRPAASLRPWRTAVVFALASLILALALGVGGGVAEARAETVVNFDGLKAGEAVTTQYEALGLKLGSSKELGGPSPGEGDCGAPTTQEGAVPAASGTKYAILPECTPAAPGTFSGTFGALVGRAGSVVGVEVRLLSSAPGPEEVELIAYGSSGQQLASARREAKNGEWRRITLAPGGVAQIRYFAIRSAKEYEPAIHVAIDNLGFEQPNEGSGGSLPPPPPPTPPSPPTATLSLQTPNPTPGKLLTLDGSASQPGSGRIISYGWDFNDDGKIDTSTGTNPIAHLMLGPGRTRSR